MSAYEQILELLGLAEKQSRSANQYNERMQLAQLAITIIKSTKSTIDTVLRGLEEDVKNGKITKQEDIQHIEELRQKFNQLPNYK